MTGTIIKIDGFNNLLKAIKFISNRLIVAALFGTDVHCGMLNDHHPVEREIK